MAVTYVEGGVDRLSRLREAIADTAGAISDARLIRWLDDTRSQEHLRIYLPTGTDGATGATVAIALDGTNLKLTLQRTKTPSEAASVCTYAPGGAYPRIENIIDWIGSLDQGWQCAIAIGRDVDWFEPTTTEGDWLASCVTTASLARYAPSVNLALLSSTACYGDDDDAARLQFYRLYSAAQQAVSTQDVGSLRSQTEGNMSLAYRGVTDTIGVLINQRASQGIYAV